MRETALRMAFLRPGITEIDVEAVYLARRKDILDVIDVKDQQANILEFLFRDLLRSRIQDILLHLDADVIVFRMTFCQLADKIALARAELDVERGLAAEDFRPLALLLLADFLVTAHDKIIEFMDGLIDPWLSS